MSVRNATYDLLKAVDSGSNGITFSVFPLVAPQETTSAYVVFSLQREAVRSQDGFSEEVFLTLNIYAGVLDDCVTLAGTLATALDGGSGTYDGETLHVCNWISEGGNYIEDLDKFVITQEYQLRFT